MSDEVISSLDELKPQSTNKQSSPRSWWLRRICSQNPFYLISVCLVLHGTVQWFHTETGAAFSPWPLLGLTAGYTLLLAITGFVVIRFGQVWDDARSILLIILLLFVQMSLIFDETLVSDPRTGRLLLLTCWGFSAVLSELLLRGLSINLPWLFRLPYHALLALLFFYPLSLVSVGAQIPADLVVWRIFLFPVAASILLLTLIPAIRRGSQYTRNNGTPWQWPWYPWSLFVFLAICVCFRAYALSQSFDRVLTESFESAMNFSSAFGVYFLVPMILAAGVLLLEIGLVEARPSAVKLALFVPAVCIYLSFPSLAAFGPYDAFLRTLTRNWGSPVWMTVIACAGFYAIAVLRKVRSAEPWLVLTLLLLTRVNAQTIDLTTLSSVQWWPLIALAAIEFSLGLATMKSRPIFVAICSLIIVFQCGSGVFDVLPPSIRSIVAAVLLVLSVLAIGASFRDDFAWFLRLAGAPLLVLSTVAGCILIELAPRGFPVWIGPFFVAMTTLTAFRYGALVGMPFYRFAGLICCASGSLSLTETAVVYVIRESGWRGATSFVSGIGFLMIAVLISSWKAGWLRNVGPWLKRTLVVAAPTSS